MEFALKESARIVGDPAATAGEVPALPVGCPPELNGAPPVEQLHVELSLALESHRNAELQAENELLVRALLGAQRLQAAAERECELQARSLFLLARELRSMRSIESFAAQPPGHRFLALPQAKRA